MKFFHKTEKLVGSKRTKRWRRKPPHHGGPVNHEPIPRSIIDQQMNKDVDGEKPLTLTKRWWDWP